MKTIATSQDATRATGSKSIQKPPYDWRAPWLAVLPPLLGLGLLIGVWALVSISTASSIPSLADTFRQAVVIFRDPFYRKAPNDQGVGWNILASLQSTLKCGTTCGSCMPQLQRMVRQLATVAATAWPAGVSGHQRSSPQKSAIRDNPPHEHQQIHQGNRSWQGRRAPPQP